MGNPSKFDDCVFFEEIFTIVQGLDTFLGGNVCHNVNLYTL